MSDSTSSPLPNSEPPPPPAAPIPGPSSDGKPPAAAAEVLPGRALRFAGAVLLMNALLSLLWLPFTSSADPSFMRSPVPAVIDILIGISLIRGQTKYRGWAIFRVIAGLVLMLAMAGMKSDWGSALGVALLGACVLLLLLGRAGRQRILVAAALYGLWFLLSMVGFMREITGYNVIGRVALGVNYGLTQGAVEQAVGEAKPWKMYLPQQHWLARRPESAHRDNPIADRWFVWPERDLHALVIVEPLDRGSVLSMDAYVNAILENGQKAGSAFKLISREPIPGHKSAVMLHSENTIDKMDMAFYSGLFIENDCAYQVVTWGEKRHIAKVEGELQRIITSFRPAQSQW